jgi:predicted RND superfamily exporter protein
MIGPTKFDLAVTEDESIAGARLRGLGRAIIKWRLWIVTVTVLFVSVVGYGATFLIFNPDSRLFFDPNDPERLALESLEDTYARANNLIFILAPSSGSMFSQRRLQAVGTLTRRAWQIPHAFRVESIANHQTIAARDDEIIVRALFRDDAVLKTEEIEYVRKTALASKSLVGRLVSPDGTVAAIEVLVNNPGTHIGEIPAIAGGARRLAAELEKEFPNIDVRLSGGVMADMTFAEAGELDVRTLIPVMIGLIVLVLWAGSRSLISTFATMLVVAFSVLIALGAGGWSGAILNSATAGAPVMIMTLAVADCVHVLTAAAQQRLAGKPAIEALNESFRLNLFPVAITSLTTALGFAALNFSEAPPLRDLGNMVAIGVVVAFVLSVTFFPAFLSYFPDVGGAGLVAGVARMNSLALFAIRHRRAILITFMLIIPCTLIGITRIGLDDDFVKYFDRNHPFRVDSDFMQEKLGGLHVLMFSVPADGENGVTDPTYLAKLDAFAEWYRNLDGVTQVSDLGDLMKRLNQTMHDDDLAFRRIPESRELASQFLLVYELSLPSGFGIDTMVDIAKSKSLVLVRVADVGAAGIRRLGEMGEAWLRSNAPGMATPVTGLSTLYAHISERNLYSMTGGTLVALLAISGTLIVVLRSLRIGLISLAPNLMPAIIAFGIWGFTVREVNLAVTVVGAMTLGIVVDDTVHFLSKYQWARRRLGHPPEQAILATYSIVGFALLLTTVALVTGFSVLVFSSFAISSQMGLLCAITVLAALVADLLFLPALILQLSKRVS